MPALIFVFSREHTSPVCVTAVAPPLRHRSLARQSSARPKMTLIIHSAVPKGFHEIDRKSLLPRSGLDADGKELLLFTLPAEVCAARTHSHNPLRTAASAIHFGRAEPAPAQTGAHHGSHGACCVRRRANKLPHHHNIHTVSYDEQVDQKPSIALTAAPARRRRVRGCEDTAQRNGHARARRVHGGP